LHHKETQKYGNKPSHRNTFQANNLLLSSLREKKPQFVQFEDMSGGKRNGDGAWEEEIRGGSRKRI
jgi:hypothetical protein